MSVHARATITGVHPLWASPGARLTIDGADFAVDGDRVPEVRLRGAVARVVFASSRRLIVTVPADVDGGRTPLRVDGAEGETAFVEIARTIATGIHQVDSPAIDREGRVYLTYSGSRGQQSAVSVFRVGRDGGREPFVTGLVNATSLAFDPAGRLHVSSRFEGTVYRVDAGGRFEPVATDLGVACGLAFGPDGTLFVGDRSGTVFRMTPDGVTTPFATLPSSVAAFHLAVGPDEALYVTAPTLASHDPVYRVDRDGAVGVYATALGRPQGLAFDQQGRLYVADSLAGGSGVYLVRSDGSRDLVMSAVGVVGLAFDPGGGVVVASSDTASRLDVDRRPLSLSSPVPS
jgi:sugar lactone lactonase YvrE